MKNEIENIHQDVYNNIKQLMDQARNRVSREVNNILIQTYWEIGRIIVEDEHGNLERAEYGKKLSWLHYCELLYINDEKKRVFMRRKPFKQIGR